MESFTFGLLLVPGLLALLLSFIGYFFPRFLIGNGSALTGLIILTIALLGWRTAYSWLLQQPYLQERVYVLGTGERAQRLVQGLRTSPDLGIRVVGWSGAMEGAPTRDNVAEDLLESFHQHDVHRVIVAVSDRRGAIPMEELLRLRLRGVKIEEATSWLEKMSGRIEVEQLYPSWLIFAEGFRFSTAFLVTRRLLSLLVSLVGLLLSLPLIPFIALAIKLTSPGPVFYSQKRVGLGGSVFFCHKFRTMRQDAEADTGATWANDDDPRITKIGKFLRSSRLDEIPQLWCVLKGRHGICRAASGASGVRRVVEQGNSLLRCSAHRSAGNYRMGAGPLQVWQHDRGCEGKAAVRSRSTSRTHRWASMCSSCSRQ